MAAVAYLGEHFAGKESAAALLARLLEPPRDDPFAEHSQQSAAVTPQLAQAIITALAANGTPQARQTIERFLVNESKVGGNPTLATMALKVIFGFAGQESDDLLFRAITSATRAGERLPPDMLASVAASASEMLRVRLANYMASSDTPQAIYDELWTCLRESWPENLAAQVVLYNCRRPAPRTSVCWKRSSRRQAAPQ